MLILAMGLAAALAGDVLVPGQPQLDRPTLTALGVKLPVSGDDNCNAAVSVRYRPAGTEEWRPALPLHRVRPEVVRGWNVEPQLSGSIFDLRPATTYEIELRAADPDGPVEETFTLTAKTRGVPGDPAEPSEKPVASAAELTAALARARPGDVILLADGVYSGPFSMRAAGTAENPIVIRGASQEGAILDGNGCASCNVLEVYGAGFVHLERFTLRNANRGIRFQTAGAEANVVRRVRILDVRLGIGSQNDQKDFYIADNVVEGRLRWPAIYTDDNGARSNDDGIRVQGNGHVIAHNRISGFGDAMKVQQNGSRAVDFYGNEVLASYDNGVELDGSEANARCLRNRFTNNYATLSVQPVYGGPAYLIRNVVVNTVHEQMKFHALGGTPPQEPSGIFAWHNTFVSPSLALNLETSDPSHHFVIANNLFIGPAQTAAGRTVNWTGPIDDGVFDYNGYYPDGVFALRLPLEQGGYSRFANFAALQKGGIEAHGLLLAPPFFAGGLTAPAGYRTELDPPDAVLHAQSSAIDRGLRLPNVNDEFTGAAPDLGALELGCPAPFYGPRPEGVDESAPAPVCSPTRENP
ncbi:MAG: right-handed parallel beta-helix repeat-containing protein [Acidobacteria bacterium]|nr:right-handed parallel beta-helix repeat-containing protein [Acidobacteriota bacterium]